MQNPVIKIMKHGLIFNSLVDIPSYLYPDEFLVFKVFIIFSTLEETNFKFIFGKGVVKVCNK
jgi:hypothetical protein